jgi:hypothetical protein
MQKQVLSSVGGANLKETICFYFSKKYIFEKNSDHMAKAVNIEHEKSL